ncbi:MAG TPA: methyltransferase domain-containing protein, partial [Cryptosporangiaceae bacterium]|nr:methyltransferase domain-containing protein [Cryptosporangiaceae bacterium]
MAKSAVYTHGHDESVLRSHRWRTAENSAAYLVPFLAPGMSLLDVGCGPGTLTADLAARVAPGRVTAVETTQEALDLARAEAAARGVTTVAFAVADVQVLDFPDDTFDVCMRTRCFGTSAIRRRHCVRCGGSADPVAWSPPATATTRRSPGIRRCPSWTSASCTARSAAGPDC